MYMYEIIGINNYDKAKNYKDNSHEWIVLQTGTWICYTETIKNRTLYINCNLSRVFWKYFRKHRKCKCDKEFGFMKYTCTYCSWCAIISYVVHRARQKLTFINYNNGHTILLTCMLKHIPNSLQTVKQQKSTLSVIPEFWLTLNTSSGWRLLSENTHVYCRPSPHCGHMH